MSNERTVPVEAEGLRLLTDAELDVVSGGAASAVACAKLTELQSTLPSQAAKGSYTRKLVTA